jgi:hypothetical protein
MKKLAVLAAILFATAAFAVDAPKGPVTLEAKQGNVTFNHSKHAAVKCDQCHQGAPGKIGKMEKDAAHKMCQTCHKAEKKGPQKCAECHVKAK